MRARGLSIRGAFSAVLLAVLVLAGCGTPATKQTATTVDKARGRPEATANIGGATEPDCRIRQVNSVVSVGRKGDSSPKKISSGKWRELPGGSIVRTDAGGEGELQFRGCASTIYIYGDSELRTSTCTKAEARSGLAICNSYGTLALDDDCADKLVIQTRTAEITLEGTWVSVTYLPGRKLTLTRVLEGRAIARPVVDSGTGKKGAPVRVDKGQFWFTEPESAEPLVGLDARRPHPEEKLAPLVEELAASPDGTNLEDWMTEVDQSAVKDDVAPGATPGATSGATPGADAVVTATPVTEASGLPDLVVADWSTTGDARWLPNGSAEIPIRLTVANRGDAPSGSFDVGFRYSSPAGSGPAPFTIDSQSPLMEQLETDVEVVYEGRIALPAELADTSVELVASVDSCGGNDGDACNVAEGDESNNVYSTGVTVQLPPPEAPSGLATGTPSTAP